MEIVKDEMGQEEIKAQKGAIDAGVLDVMSKLKQKEVNPQKAPEYDPNKKYKWEPTDKFVIDGIGMREFINATRSILNTPEAQRMILVMRANEVAENALARAVEAGIAKEIVK